MIDNLKTNFPLHFYAWHNNYAELDEVLQHGEHDIEKLDPHGRTPLMLAVILDHIECTRVLLRHGADASFVSKSYWSVSQEAIATGDPQLVKLILVHRDAQAVRHQGIIMAELLQKLRDTGDFYIEMKWEFTSWLPLVSRMCPSDVCRVWKRGPNLRIDTNLIGFDGSASWVRGQLSYIFRVSENEATMDEVNHSERVIYRHNIPIATSARAGATAAAAAQLFVREPSDAVIANKLTQPIFVTYLDTEKIEFEKSKAGIWGWRHDRKESINNHNCQVYCASNVQIVTLRRTEHLTEENLRDLNRRSEDTGGAADRSGSGPTDIVFPGAGQGNLLTTLLQTAASESKEKANLDLSHEAPTYNPNDITIEQYFNMDGAFKSGLDVGRPRAMTTKVKTFKARLWLCKDFPLSLSDQVIPIIDLMSEYNPYFHKLKEFLTKQLPPGFPLKVEIPLYHVLNACISFGNVHGQETSVYGVTTVPIEEQAEKATLSSGDSTPRPLISSSDESKHGLGGVETVRCIVDESVFDVGSGYHVIVENSPGHYGALDEEEQMVQMAVQRSLVEYGTAEDLMQRGYSLRKRQIIEARPDEYVEPEEAWLQQAIEASLTSDGGDISVSASDETYLKVLEESRLEQEREERRRKMEEEELARVLELSTREK